MNPGRRYYFITIAETLNITRAAEQLMVSQPSLTQYLNKLESDLEIKLVDRSFTPLRLPEAGHVYYDYLVKQRSAEEALNAALKRLRCKGRRPLMIGIPLQKSHELAACCRTFRRSTRRSRWPSGRAPRARCASGL